MAASVAVSVMLDWPVVPVIALFTTVSIVYISWGGIKAVVWTNVFQAAVFTLSGLLSLGFLILAVDGGAAGIFREALAHGRLSVLDFGPAWSGEGWLGRAISDPNLVWLAVINGFFTSMASFGTDQELVQRLLTVESRSQSQRSILLTIAGSTFVVVLYLCVGAGLFAFYGQHPELALPKELDKIYPHFAVQALPSLLRGLVLCAVVMASIDSPLASLATSFVTDLYRPLSRRPTGGGFELALSRVCVAAFGILLAAVAWFFCRFDRMLWLAFKIGGVTYGSLLGVFLLGLLTRRRADRANAAAMITMAALNLWLLVRMERGAFPLGWSWLILLGTLGTAALAWLLGPLLDRDPGPIPRAGP
jgi:Na+/proline symporter